MRLALLLLLTPTLCLGQVAFDAFSDTLSATGDFTFTHTPVGTPSAVIVGVIQTSSEVDRVNTITYGGSAMTELASGPHVKATGEACALYLYYILASIPTGAQQVFVDVTGAGAKTAWCVSLTAVTPPIELVDSDISINSDSDDNPTLTIELGGRTCFVLEEWFSGIPDPLLVVPLLNWTAAKAFDFGASTSGMYYYNIISTTDVTGGYTATADDAVIIAVAFAEAPSGKRKVVIVQ